MQDTNGAQSLSATRNDVANKRLENSTIRIVAYFQVWIYLWALVTRRDPLAYPFISNFTNCNQLIYPIQYHHLIRFSQNIDFDNCLKREFSIDINRIETIEVALGQHYLLIQYASPPSLQQGKSASKTAPGSTGLELKFVTYDIYQTQTFLSILMSTLRFESIWISRGIWKS